MSGYTDTTYSYTGRTYNYDDNDHPYADSTPPDHDYSDSDYEYDKERDKADKADKAYWDRKLDPDATVPPTTSTRRAEKNKGWCVLS